MNKIILHLDFNSYFASVEQQANPFLRGKAVAVGGKGRGSQLERTVITTASRQAKDIGIKTAMSSIEAKRLVPNLKIVSGDPKKYSEITKRFLSILKRHCDVVEQFSTDEAFGELTYAAGDYFGATMIAQIIRAEIAEECGEYCTVSIGIAPNKLVAKLACESQKPNGLTVIPPDKVSAFVATQPLSAICGIGPRIESRLANIGVTSVLTLRKISLENLRHEFKSYGDWLYAAARGIGDDVVVDGKEAPKTIGHSYTFPHDLVNDVEIQTNLLALCDKVTWRMRRDGFIAGKIGIYVRYQGFYGRGAQKNLSEPFMDGLELFSNAWKLLSTIRNKNLPIRLLGVRASGLIKTNIPAHLFPKQNKVHKTLKALDTLQTRYGAGVWMRASTMNTNFYERTSGWHYDHEI
ncbi:DNA polymerase IV [Candidatus Uhrbacteria bacterium]|nr:DNA polymerase IV [Candidatus Uhrbacteria bacterium]